MLSLTAGDLSLVLTPELGGSLLGWSQGGVHLLRHADPRAVVPGTVREMGSFPLIPYSNRIALGRFRFAGTQYQLARNFGDHPHSIHGVGWQRVWQVIQVARDAATLSLRHRADAAWPFAFTATQQIRLTHDALLLTLTLINDHPTPSPAGLGLHPFFPRAGATLRFVAESVWHNGPDHLPSACTPVPPEWDHCTAREVGGVALDNCFAGWTGTASMVWPERTLTLTASEAFGHLVVYTPPGHGFFCVEPVSHMNDGINRDAMRVLAPGETLAGTISFRLS